LVLAGLVAKILLIDMLTRLIPSVLLAAGVVVGPAVATLHDLNDLAPHVAVAVLTAVDLGPH
jgi:ferredoxin-NADP reductase